MPIDRYLQHLAIRVNGPTVDTMRLCFDWVMSDEKTRHRVTLRHGALTALAGSHEASADAVLTLDRPTLVAIVESGSDFLAALDDGRLKLEGDREAMRQLFASLDVFDFGFNIVEP